MIPFKRNLVLTLLVGVVVLAMIPTSGYSRLVTNGSSGGYDDGSGSSGTASRVQSVESALEMYIIEGAGYYLNAYSDILAFLNRVEESDIRGMNFSEAQQILDRAIANMNGATRAYYYLIRRAEVTPYKDTVIAKLVNFDYAGFRDKWQLNGVLFAKVESYLGRGDITGVYKYIYTEFSEINRILYAVKTDLALGKIPEMAGLWRLNEKCSQTMLFGQYVSRLFFTLLAIK